MEAHPAPSPFLSSKMRFWGFASMVALVYVHGYNLHESYLQPFTLPQEPATFTAFFEYLTANGLLRFRIPMLFAISGYLYALGDAVPNGRRMLKRLRTLAIPYLLWGLVALGISYGLEHLNNDTCQAVLDAGMAGPYQMEDYGWGMYVHAFFFPIAYQLWFLRALIALNLAYPLLKKGLARRPSWMFGVAILLWLPPDLSVPFFSPEGLLFFMLGVWLAKNGGVPAQPPFHTKAWHWMAAWLVLAVGKTAVAFAFPEYGPWVLGLSFVHKLTVATGLVAAWYGLDGLVQACMASRAFRWACSFSFVIYALHAPLVNYATRWLFLRGAGEPYARLLVYLLLPLALVAFCIAVGAALRTLLPGVYAVLTGGRGRAPKPAQPALRPA